jgi:hypothetical protein
MEPAQVTLRTLTLDLFLQPFPFALDFTCKYWQSFPPFGLLTLVFKNTGKLAGH